MLEQDNPRDIILYKFFKSIAIIGIVFAIIAIRIVINKINF